MMATYRQQHTACSQIQPFLTLSYCIISWKVETGAHKALCNHIEFSSIQQNNTQVPLRSIPGVWDKAAFLKLDSSRPSCISQRHLTWSGLYGPAGVLMGLLWSPLFPFRALWKCPGPTRHACWVYSVLLLPCTQWLHCWSTASSSCTSVSQMAMPL